MLKIIIIISNIYIYMKNHFFIGYAGNKRNEVDIIYETMKDDIEKIKTIVEPYCGTSAISYYISLQHPKKFKYILNDSNIYLIEIYNILKSEKETIKFNKSVNKIVDKINKIESQEEKKKYYNSLKENNSVNYYLKHKYYNIRAGLFPFNKTFKCVDLNTCEIVNFLRSENIIISNVDAIEIIEKYKDNKNVLLILDPPYMNVCNDFYIDKNMNIYEYLFNNNIDNMICKVYLILENMWINKLLFQTNHIHEPYNKTYEGSKKKTSHIIIKKSN